MKVRRFPDSCDIFSIFNFETQENYKSTKVYLFKTLKNILALTLHAIRNMLHSQKVGYFRIEIILQDRQSAIKKIAKIRQS